MHQCRLRRGRYGTCLRGYPPLHRETGAVVEQDQKGLPAARSHERNHFDADLARIEMDVAAGRDAGLAGLADGGKDLEEQLWANDPSQVEAWWASGRLEIRPGLAAKLQNGKSLVHEHARRRKTRQ